MMDRIRGSVDGVKQNFFPNFSMSWAYLLKPDAQWIWKNIPGSHKYITQRQYYLKCQSKVPGPFSCDFFKKGSGLQEDLKWPTKSQAANSLRHSSRPSPRPVTDSGPFSLDFVTCWIPTKPRNKGGPLETSHPADNHLRKIHSTWGFRWIEGIAWRVAKFFIRTWVYEANAKMMQKDAKFLETATFPQVGFPSQHLTLFHFVALKVPSKMFRNSNADIAHTQHIDMGIITHSTMLLRTVSSGCVYASVRSAARTAGKSTRRQQMYARLKNAEFNL